MTRWLALLLALSAAPSLSGCGAPTTEVVRAPSAPLGDKVLSVQMTYQNSPMGVIDPRGRYAEKMRTQIKNRLMEGGFTLKKKSADVHIRVHLKRMTTGSAGNRSDCEIEVTGYSEWPGDLEAAQKNKYPPELPEPDFVAEIAVTERGRNQGYERERLAKAAAARCVDEVVLFVTQSR